MANTTPRSHKGSGNSENHQKTGRNRTPIPPNEDHPAGALPPFDDPAFSPVPATPAVSSRAKRQEAPPKDTQYAGHPDFSQDAAKNKPPKGTGLTESIDEDQRRTGKSEGVNVAVFDGRRPGRQHR